MKFIKAVLFDFDGVILDSSREGFKRIKKLAVEKGIKVPSDALERAKKYWGLPGTELMKELFDIDSERAEELYQYWVKYDEERMMPLVENGYNVLEMIVSYFKKFCGIVTSRNRANLIKIIDYYSIGKFFYEIQTRDDSEFYKPDPRVFEKMLKKLKPIEIKKEDCIFIGDTINDLKAAKGAGIEFFASIGTSLTPKERFINEGLDEAHMIYSIAELPLIIFEYRPLAK